MALTDAKLRALKSEAKEYKVADSLGLKVLVSPSGSRLWRLAYRFNGKQKMLALGAYPAVSLAAARTARDAARKLVSEGIDPGEQRKGEKRRARIAAGHTFEAVANEWFENKKAGWVDSYSERLRSRLDNDLLPALGARPLAEIEPIEVLDAIRKIEKRDAIEMGRRVMQMAGSIFRYGVATSRCVRDPTADLRGALKTPAPVQHRAALAEADLPEFFARMREYDGEPSTRLALNLVLLTFVRTVELRFAEPKEFSDLDGPAPLWRIPAERMKMGRADHLVPLSPQAVAVIKELLKLNGGRKYLLHAKTKSGVISENTMLYALYRMGYHSRATVHGFRSTASTVLNENGFNPDWIEIQLAHDDDDEVRAAYNAAQYLPGRREMMNWWANFLDRKAEDQEIADLLG